MTKQQTTSRRRQKKKKKTKQAFVNNVLIDGENEDHSEIHQNINDNDVKDISK